MLDGTNAMHAEGHESTFDQRIEFGVLGPFELRVDGRAIEVGSPKHRALLATLVLQAGKPVLIGELAEAVWGSHQPGNPRRAVQLYVTRLRELLGNPASPPTTMPIISTSADGYQINIRPEQIDLGRFRHCLHQARQAAERSDLDGEATALAEALAQWRGNPLAGIPSDVLQREIAPRLREQWLQAVERHFDVELRRGRHAGLVGELFAATAQRPLHEPLWVRLITALHRSGRRADALEAYHTVRRQLADELGVDPGEELRDIYARVLMGEQPTVRKSALVIPTPRQLPADVPAFVGRAEELALLDGLISGQPSGTDTATVAVITGTAGIGKTALASHWARRVADRFPDGQLWVNLRGFGNGQSVTPEQALPRFLRALGIPDVEVPFNVDEQSDLYRSLMDGRQVLVVLDNAKSAEQVRPLLPGAPGSLVVVTSRSRLSGLMVMEHAYSLVLDLLSHADACELLNKRLGTARIFAEPSAVEEIVNLCARLPLALAIVAARAAARPSFGLNALAGELRRARGSLDAFAGPDSAIEARAVFSWSYLAMSAPAARLFRLLGLHPGPEISTGSIASLSGLTTSEIRPLLAELTNAHLIAEHNPGRYAFHDLMRAYANELSANEESASTRREAVLRMLNYYVYTAGAAALKSPAFEAVQLGSPPPDV